MNGSAAFVRGSGNPAPWSAYGEPPLSTITGDSSRRPLMSDAYADRGPDAGAGYPGISGEFAALPLEPTSVSRERLSGFYHERRRHEDEVHQEQQWEECWNGLVGRSLDMHTPGGTSGSASLIDSAPIGSNFSAGRLPQKPSHAAGVRHIANWLRSVPGVTGSEARRATLRTEHQELVREQRTERLAAEELQARLSAEMRELRDQCQEQGQTVGMLAQRLSDARNAVTAELRGAAALHSTLGTELQSEESQRRALEAARRGEEAEIAHRVEAAEQQLSTMSGVRASLEAQLHASHRVQAELREHISAERGGRSELKVAGERELTAWSEHNERVCGELRSRLRSERAEVDTWRESTAEEVSRLKEESEENTQEENQLMEQLQGVRQRQSMARRQLRSEVSSWNLEVEVLRERCLEVDEEHKQTEDALQRHTLSLGACGDERIELEEELQDRLGQASAAQDELQTLQCLSGELHDELREFQSHVQYYRADEEVIKLREERDRLIREVSRETEHHKKLREDIESERKSWGFLCMKRRQVPNSPPMTPTLSPASQPAPAPLPPPQHEPPRDQHRQQTPTFPQGSLLVTTDSAKVRAGEDMESEFLRQLEPGQHVVVMEQGTARGAGRRLKVSNLDTNQIGWISSHAPRGQPLVELVPEEADASPSVHGLAPHGGGSSSSGGGSGHNPAAAGAGVFDSDQV